MCFLFLKILLPKSKNQKMCVLATKACLLLFCLYCLFSFQKLEGVSEIFLMPLFVSLQKEEALSQTLYSKLSLTPHFRVNYKNLILFFKGFGII